MSFFKSTVRTLPLLFAVGCTNATGDGATGSKSQAVTEMYTVTPVLFVPTDWAVDGAEVRDEATHLQDAMDEIQAFYASALSDTFSGKTFRMEDLQVLQAYGPKEDYAIHWNGGNIYEDGVEFTGNMEHEVVSELYSRGFTTPPAQNEDGHVTLIFVKGAGGYAGGRELGAADGGWALMGDWAIDSIQGDVLEGEYWWSGARKQTGAAAHELGHAFGLPHPPEGEFAGDIMGWWWDYPEVGFSSTAKTSLSTDKPHWFVTDLNSDPVDSPCDNICENPVVLNYANVQSGNLGSAATCHEIMAPLNGMAFGNFDAPRELFLNGVSMGTSGWTNQMPEPVAGGFCISTPAGNPEWAWFATW